MERTRKSRRLIRLLAWMSAVPGILSAQLAADFSGDPLSGEAPLTVTFTDRSQGGPEGWQWSFPGGSPSSATGPGPHTVVYSAAGSYSVTLTVTRFQVTHMVSDSETKPGYIVVDEPLPMDFGDAPDSGAGRAYRYATLLANNGARHILRGNLWLGTGVDAEPDGQPDPLALGDDRTGPDDGVVFPELLIGETADLSVTVSGNGHLNAWFDFNCDGDWDDAGEYAVQNLLLATGTHAVTVFFPDEVPAGNGYTRFRFSEDTVHTYNGPAWGGEVEDYRVTYIPNICAIQDSLALVALYNSMDGPNWKNRTNWLSGRPVADWYGITVDEEKVTAVSLEHNGLNGVLPAEIGSLGRLRELNLKSNLLSGTIPPEIGNLTVLEALFISSLASWQNAPLPSEIGNCVSLTTLDIQGCVCNAPIPQKFASLTRLVRLNLSSNALTGSVPAWIDVLSDLEELNLENNPGMSGDLPSGLFTLARLKKLILNGSGLTGGFPAELGNLAGLEELSVYENNLSGPLPSSIGNLLQLKTLNLDYNGFSGSIPEKIGYLSHLQNLQLFNNQLTGNIPASIIGCENLRVLDAGKNHFSGEIPPELGDMPRLWYLNLANNAFYGNVPESFASWPPTAENQAILYLYQNDLEGLPAFSVNPHVAALFVSENRLTFEDLEPNVHLAMFHYSPQDSVGIRKDTTVETGADMDLAVHVGGKANVYQWLKDGIPIIQANDSVYALQNILPADSGAYVCRITNTVANELTLCSRPVLVHVARGTVDVSETPDAVPVTFGLERNYPNPFNAATTIAFRVKKSCRVLLKAYSLTGEEAALIADRRFEAGHYTVVFDASGLASGVYVVRMEAEGFTASRKIAVVK